MFWLTRDTLSFFNTFKFMNLKYRKTPKGILYSCRLNYGRKKIAMVENLGDGGKTSIQFFEDGKELLESLNIPKYYEMAGLNFKITTEYIVSDLVEFQIYLKQLLSMQSRTIIFISEKDEILKIPYRYTFKKFKQSGQLHLVQDQIEQIELKGGVILNTNLESVGL